jgi:alpha-glucosidase
VVGRYTDLSGKAPLPPLWALGFQQSRYSYMSAAELLGVAGRLRAEHIPADVLWMDIDYQDRNRPFTTNRLTFPDLAALAARMRQQGFRLVAITDLHIAAAPGQDYAPYDTGVAGDHFIRRADGSAYVAEVWPGPAVFPDFTRLPTRQWWGGLYRDFLAAGIAGFWNDMNEPAIFHTASKTMPLDNLHRIEEPGFARRDATHAEIHNIYGMENARATFEGLGALAPDERPFVMTRASFAGGQRYGATWTGDNSSTWNHLKLSIAMLLNLGLSGFAYSGDDVGGFNGTPGADLFTRWIELTAFMPLFRDHSMKGVAGKEPWIHGPVHTAIRRRFIEERYRLLPYFYALADENARTGAPLMRPVFYEFPDALESACEQTNSFLLGSSLLVAPSPALESPAAYEICLPAGRWYDYWTGLQARVPLTEQPRIDRLPVYVRGGTILPRQPLVQSTAATPSGPLLLDVYPGGAGARGDGECRGALYVDDGHSMNYRNQGYLRQALRCLPTPDGIRIEFGPRAGAFTPWWHEIDVRVHGWSGGARAALVSAPGSPQQSLVAKRDARARVVSVRIADPAGAAQLSIRRGP